MKVEERVAELFGQQGLLCAESVLMALCERFGKETDCAPRAASGFCSGLARTGGMCGALSGAVIAAGLLQGRDSGEQELDRVYDVTQQIVAAFCERYGSTSCRELLGLDLGTPAGQEAFREQGLRDARCIPFAVAAAAIAEQALERAGC